MQESIMQAMRSMMMTYKTQFGHGDSSDSDSILFMTITKVEEDKTNRWYLDRRWNTHMTENKVGYSNLKKIIQMKIKFADNSEVMSKRIGQVLIQRKGEHEYVTNEVLYVPKIKINLINFGHLLERNYTM